MDCEYELKELAMETEDLDHPPYCTCHDCYISPADQDDFESALLVLSMVLSFANDRAKKDE